MIGLPQRQLAVDGVQIDGLHVGFTRVAGAVHAVTIPIVPVVVVRFHRDVQVGHVQLGAERGTPLVQDVLLDTGGGRVIAGGRVELCGEEETERNR